MSEAARVDSVIRISEPALGDDVEALVLQVLRSGHLAQGPMVERFEQLCADMAGCEHAVAVVNGTVALEAALEVCGVGAGHEVITTPLTFAATLNAILRRGAVARFVDISDDFTLDPHAVAAAVTPRTSALLPVHLYGLIADMESIASIARRHDLALIEDAAQAHGAEQNGRRAGSFGTGVFSFYATKNVTSGEGGCVTTSDAAVAERIRVLRNQGMRARYEYVAIGENWRMTDVCAAVAIPQLERLANINAQRAANAARLSELLAYEPGLALPIVPPGRTHVWHQYTVLLPADVDRMAVIQFMQQRGVHAGVYYSRMVWDHDAYRHHPQVVVGDTPVAARAASRCLSLPVHPKLNATQLERVAETLLQAVQMYRKAAI